LFAYFVNYLCVILTIIYSVYVDNKYRSSCSGSCVATGPMVVYEAASCQPLWQLPQGSWVLEGKPHSVYLVLTIL